MHLVSGVGCDLSVLDVRCQPRQEEVKRRYYFSARFAAPGLHLLVKADVLVAQHFPPPGALDHVHADRRGDFPPRVTGHLGVFVVRRQGVVQVDMFANFLGQTLPDFFHVAIRGRIRK